MLEYQLELSIVGRVEPPEEPPVVPEPEEVFPTDGTPPTTWAKAEELKRTSRIRD
jgi:hypothetical protein